MHGAEINVQDFFTIERSYDIPAVNAELHDFLEFEYYNITTYMYVLRDFFYIIRFLLLFIFFMFFEIFEKIILKFL